MQVGELMTRRVECVGPEDTLQTAAEKMAEVHVEPLPVCENRRLVGILTDYDLSASSIGRESFPDAMLVREAMTRQVPYCFEDQDVAKAAQVMQDKQVHRLLVLDHNMRLVGSISTGDLRKNVARRESHFK